MSRIFNCCKTFGNDESGATAIEYALIAGILSISIVAGLMSVKTELSSTFDNVGAQLKNNSSN
jgi:pilus assembly protein Flp/PilA